MCNLINTQTHTLTLHNNMCVLTREKTVVKAYTMLDVKKKTSKSANNNTSQITL